MRITMAALAAMIVGTPVPVAAQDPGTFDAGLFARAMLVDKTVAPDNAGGVGGRLGLFVLPNVALELEAASSSTIGDTDTRFQPVYLRLTWHRSLSDKWRALFGAGWVRDRTNPDGPGGPFTDDGYTALVGLTRSLSDRWALRIDGVGDFFSTPIFETAGTNLQVNHVSVQAGLNVRFGKMAPKDADKDGITNDLDACPGTMPGESVDARGCVPPKDSDRDGVIDPNDRCADTPAGTRVDSAGCVVPVDTDRDGVMDNRDRCANTPTGTRVDADGCPVPVDTDRDGVLDNVDRCANTPVGTRVDANGCPVPVDSDGDGVLDGSDACPNTATGLRVDGRGCAVLFEEGRRSIVLEGVNFATGKAELTPGSVVILDRVALALVNAPDVSVEVQGHTDNTGSLALNTRLSGLRAEAVRAYLISKGVVSSRLTAKGYGPAVPAASNATPEGRAQNRRVELMRTN